MKLGCCGIFFLIMLGVCSDITEGEYSLSPIPDVSLTVGYTACSVIDDIDGDGLNDLIVLNGNDPHSIMIFLQEEGVNVSSHTTPDLEIVSRLWSKSLQVGDLNNDGTVDAFVNNIFLPNEVWLNDGEGIFVDSGLRMGGDEPSSKGALGDVDADGDLDVFVSFFGQGSNSVWLNETAPVCCECADCNEDGSVDIIDALWEVNCILGINPPPCSCDCNQDGSDNVLDVLCIVNIILNGSCP